MTHPPLTIAIPLFEQLTALDGIGPYEVLQRLPGATVTFVADRTGEFRTENGFLGLNADATYDDVPNPDVIVVPGGIGTRQVVRSDGHPLVDWVRSAHQTTRFTTSVCTGSLVLARAGLLDGLTAATHWGGLRRPGRVGCRPHSGPGGGAPRPADRHRGRGVVGDRHGPAAG